MNTTPAGGHLGYSPSPDAAISPVLGPEGCQGPVGWVVLALHCNSWECPPDVLL